MTIRRFVGILPLVLFSTNLIAQLREIENAFIVSHRSDTIYYQTAYFTVPENRSVHKSNDIALKILIVKSRSSSPADPVVFLAGGPGQSGINYIRQNYFQDAIASLRQHHDVILLDQRGCGASKPSLVYKVPSTDTRNIFLSPETIINIANIQAKAGADTMKARGIDIRGYNTKENANDLVDLKIALGIKRMNILAISYGTHLALASARQHPDIINRMVLIGTSGPDHMHHLPSSYDKQLKRISLLAADDSAVSRKVPDMVDLLKRVLVKLADTPITIRVKENKTGDSIPIKVGKFGLQFILRLDAGDASDFIYFPTMLYDIDHGDYQLLQEYVERRYNQLSGDYASAVGVMRTASGASKMRMNRIKKEGKSALLGNAMNTPDIYGRNFWGEIDLGEEYRTLFSSKTHTLFISGTMDSNTPIENANEVKAKFSNASDVIVKYAGHENMLSNPAVIQLFSEYFSGTPPKVNEIVGEKPTFY